MVYGEEQPLFGQIGEQAADVISPSVDLDVLALRYVVNPDVCFGAARHAAGHLFANEKVLVATQLFGSADGVMICQGKEIHAALAQHRVNILRGAVAFQEKVAQDSYRQSAREKRMNMKVAFHCGKIVEETLC